MQSAGTLDATDEKNLPTVSGTVDYPTETQLTSAQNTITTSWASALG
jgi:hypothetical protein